MKIKIVVFAFLLVYGLSACKTDIKPPGVMEQGKLAELLVDMYAGEARMSGIPIMSDSAYKLFSPFEEKLLQKKGISDSVMKITFRYYVDHPVELEQVYDVVIDTLSLREKKAELKIK